MNTNRILSSMYRIRPRRMESYHIRSMADSSVTDRLRDHYDKRSQSIRHELDEQRQKLRDTASHYRETGITKYREFRENPKETAVSSAKSASQMIRTYGPVFVGTYISVYLVTLSSLYMGVASGALDPVQLFSTMGILGDTVSSESSVDLVYHFMSKHNFSQPYAHYIQEYPALANFGVAWITAKFTEPVRIPLAITITPKVARSIGYRAKETATDTTKEKETTTTQHDTKS